MFRHTSRKLLTCLTALTLTLSAGAFPSWADGAVSGGGEPAVTEQNTDTQGTSPTAFLNAFAWGNSGSSEQIDCGGRRIFCRNFSV